jgi:hypothetical protein
MIKIRYKGRLGNNMIQYAAGAILAEKTGLCLKTKAKRTFSKILNTQTIDGICHNETIELTDESYSDHHYNPEPNTGYILKGFFQDSRLLCDHREKILDLYKLPKPKKSVSSCDAFFACRLGDCLTSHRTYCSMKYIEDQLITSRDSYDNVYVTSDTINHPPLVKLIKKYNLTVYQDSPVNTILFAAQFNNLILSAGSFSYWMAYLSSAENITVYHNKKTDSLQRNNAWSYNKKVKFIK